MGGEDAIEEERRKEKRVRIMNCFGTEIDTEGIQTGGFNVRNKSTVMETIGRYVMLREEVENRGVCVCVCVCMCVCVCLSV